MLNRIAMLIVLVAVFCGQGFAQQEKYVPYEVKSGDRLYRIARQFTGSGIKHEKFLNARMERFANPDLIFPGEIVNIPVSLLNKQGIARFAQYESSKVAAVAVKVPTRNNPAPDMAKKVAVTSPAPNIRPQPTRQIWLRRGLFLAIFVTIFSFLAIISIRIFARSPEQAKNGQLLTQPVYAKARPPGIERTYDLG